MQIIRFAPLGVLVSTPTTILGAHCDSLNYKNYTDLAPGAGEFPFFCNSGSRQAIDVDDGSGTVSILEAYRGGSYHEKTVSTLTSAKRRLVGIWLHPGVSS